MTPAAVREHAAAGPHIPIHLREWERVAPSSTGQASRLQGLSFGNDTRARALAADLARRGVVTLTELHEGVCVEAGSFVGRLSVGPLDISIAPKVTWDRWLRLVGYALRVRELARSGTVSMRLNERALQDVVILALCREARALVFQGMHREYVRHRRSLAFPRGRIDFTKIARHGGLREPAIPSRYTRRSDDFPLNQTLLAGLRLAFALATEADVRADAGALARQMEESVSPATLSAALLRTTRQRLDRRTMRYLGALQLIELLWSGHSVTYERHPDGPEARIPGFALDMNRLWQRLLERVLMEWQDEVTVRHEFALRAVFTRNPEYPVIGRLPVPRPDFAVLANGQPVGFLDAKYRDLWERPFPREMLYQLSLYAVAQGRGVTAVLYPSHARDAREQRIDIRDPLTGAVRGSIGLRPVHLAKLEELVAAPMSDSVRWERRAFAKALLMPGVAEGIPSI